MAVLDDIKTLLNIQPEDTSKDPKLTLYKRRGITLIQNYLNIPTEAYTDSTGTVIQPIDVETTYPDALIEYVVFCMNKRGNEGVKQFTQGARSVTYSSDLPDSVANLLPLPFARMC